GEHRWRLPALDQVEIVKIGASWKFSTATIKAIPSLHAETIPPLLDRILDVLPVWFNDRVLGIAIWQLCAILLFVLVALVLQKLAVFILGTYVRRATGRLVWVEKAMGRIARPIGGLVMAGVFYMVTPWLQLSVRVSQIARAGTLVLAAFCCTW